MARVRDAVIDWAFVARLVDRARSGDEEAFRRLLESHSRAVSTTLMACGVRDPETARDLAQEVAIRCWTQLPTLQDSRAFPAWLRRIAANLVRDHLRRVKPEIDDLEAVSEVPVDGDPETDAGRRHEVRERLRVLQEEDAETIEVLMALAEGTSVKELAERLGVSPAALKMRVSRARKRLRSRLEED